MGEKPPSFSAADFKDASAQEAGLTGWSQTYCQLMPGAYDGHLDTLALDGVSISRERINVPIQQRTAPPKGQVVFVQERLDRATWRLNGAGIAPGSVSVIRNGEEQSVAFSDASDILIVSVDEARLSDGEGGRPSTCSAPASESFNFFATWILSILAQFAIIDGVAAAELAGVLPGMIVDRLQYVDAKLRADPRGARADRSGILALFRKASRIAEDEAGEGLTVADLARRAGVPADVLRQAFLETAGVGPGHWLRSRRLDGARRDLMRAAETGETVTEIAARWGFFHFGRFSAAYADFYGEAPSRTIRGGRSQQ